MGKAKKSEFSNTSENSYKNLFENSLVGISQVNPDGQLIRANSAYLNMYGYSSLEEMVHEIKNVSMLYAFPQERAEVLSTLAKSGFMEPREFTLKKRDGAHIIVLVSARVIQDVHGEVECYQAEHVEITKFKRIEKELIISNSRFQNAMEAGRMAWWEMDCKTGEVLFHENKARILGYSPEQFRHYTDFTVLVHPEDFENTMQAMRDHLSGIASKYDTEYRIKSSDGTYHWFRDLGGVTSRDENGFPLKVSGFVIDISDKKGVESQLRESELKYRLLSEESGMGIGLYSPEGEILYFNKKAIQYLGGEPSDYIGKSLSEVFGTLAGAEYIRRIQIVIQTDQSVLFEDHVDYPSGSFWFLSNHTRICNPEGKVIGVQVLVQDITNRKTLEETLSLNAASLRSLIENTSSIIWAVDTNYCLTECNLSFKERFKRVAGVDISKGENVINGFPAHIQGDWLNYFKRGMAGESFEVVRKDIPNSVYSFIKYNLNPIRTEEGQIVGITIIGQDITDIVKYENKLANLTGELRNLTQHLVEVREAERKQIANDLHDDLGQKLTALSMDLIWLKARIGVQSRVVINKLNQVTLLIADSISSVQKMSFSLRPGILDDLGLEAAIDSLLKEFGRSSDIICTAKIVPEAEKMDNGKSLAIFRIIQESLTNVSRHSHATSVSIDLIADRKNYWLTIKDNGVGINYKKVNNKKSFGLIGMRERVLLLDGEFKIEGVKDKGTTITVRIPYKKFLPKKTKGDKKSPDK